MIRIKRITDIERLAETVSKPKDAVPKFGLPGWKMMPLEHKIPMIPGPKGAYSLVRRKVGKKLWGQKLEFDLSDPYCHETKFPYEPLHDEHLLEFFYRPINRKRLLKADLITDDMHVKCTLRDYNEYRKYLRQVHADRVNRELRKRNGLFGEKRALRFAEEQARNEAERLKERETYVTLRQRLTQQRLLEEERKTRELKERACRTARRLKLLRLVRREEQRLLNIKSKERVEQIRQKCKIATEITRRKVIDTLLDWRKKDKARKKGREKRLMEITQQKQKAMEESWRKKQRFQEKEIAKQKVLLQRIDARREKFIENYNNRINKETARMKKLLDDAKLYTNCYMKRRLPDGRMLICCKKYFKNDVKEKFKEKVIRKIQ
ncbi:PREDICTED: fibrous sheath-interacting protein 2 isoform X2 [Wasmannia auropunctata]|uniref:fibrous sheath-interacting protein 2 isoform X2 n=1 Tax=Wasmannia auropunctata TaxID=64793 RepID=UPI0005F03C9F|nr:PREDICTED: fibrous sheath-interacting protein 2 isoform X2 [Wasmannia auropunctata]